MDWIVNFAMSTSEYQEWGWNIIAASFLLTAVLTFVLQLPGLINQARTIWRNRSAQGVETLTFIAVFTYFIVFLVYALSIHSGAGIVNTIVLIPPQLFILAGIARFKYLRSIDTLAGLAGIVLFILIVILPHKEIFFTIASVAVFIGLLLQPIEMIKTKTSANIALSFPFGFMIVAAVWTIYGVAVSDWFIAGASGVFAFTYIWIIALWFKYRL